MVGMIPWKLERRVNLCVTQPQGMVGERPWIEELLPNTGYVQPIERSTLTYSA